MADNQCIECSQSTRIHAKGLCYPCYRKQWTPKKIICKSCGKKRSHHGRGYCGACHMKTFHYDKIKKFNIRKYHNIPVELYNRLATKCIVCGFDKVIDLHHLDHDRTNNSESNLVPLCPNHHRMLHTSKFNKEIVKKIKESLNENFD